MATRAKKRYTITFTNDRGAGSFGTYKSRAKAEEEMNRIIRHDAYETSIGYADLHLRCEIVESIIY